MWSRVWTVLIVVACGCSSSPRPLLNCTLPGTGPGGLAYCAELSGSSWNEMLARATCEDTISFHGYPPGAVSSGTCPAPPHGYCVLEDGAPTEQRFFQYYSGGVTEAEVRDDCCTATAFGAAVSWVSNIGGRVLCVAPDGG